MTQRDTAALPPEGRGQVMPGEQLSHRALVYRDDADCLATAVPFARDGLARGEAILVGVGPATARRLGETLGDHWPDVAVFDMGAVGRNPGRIIAAMWDFLSRQGGRPARFISEPFWPERSAAEVAEAARHEALVNQAFAGTAASALCLYAASALAPSVVSDAARTHPVVICGGHARVSAQYAAAGSPAPQYERPLQPPPADARALSYDEKDLRPARSLVSEQAARAGLSRSQVADLALAVGEAAGNTLRHGRGHGTVQVWKERQEVICQISDEGHIADPLAGRKRPSAAASGYGLWLIHQVCDLVELRTGPRGTILRLHMHC